MFKRRGICILTVHSGYPSLGEFRTTDLCSIAQEAANYLRYFSSSAYFRHCSGYQTVSPTLLQDDYRRPTTTSNVFRVKSHRWFVTVSRMIAVSKGTALWNRAIHKKATVYQSFKSVQIQVRASIDIVEIIFWTLPVARNESSSTLLWNLPLHVHTKRDHSLHVWNVVFCLSGNESSPWSSIAVIWTDCAYKDH